MQHFLAFLQLARDLFAGLLPRNCFTPLLFTSLALLLAPGAFFLVPKRHRNFAFLFLIFRSPVRDAVRMPYGIAFSN